jgi:hypothetical protein
MILRTPFDENNDGIRVVDDREPAHYWTNFQRDRAHPLARGIPYVEGSTHRHLFDALVSYGTEHEQPDNPALSEEENWRHPPANHREFRMNLTCVECGQIVALEGLLTRDDLYKRVDAEPLRAKHLTAQHTSSWGSGRFNSWAVYAGEDLVGAMSTGMGTRGRVFVEGYVVDADGAKHKSEAPTSIGLLRKLASAHAQKPAA